MTRDPRIASALVRLIDEAGAMESFLSPNAPHWAGSGQNIVNCATEVAGREMSREDLRTLDDRVNGPYRGTFGSMHDLSFAGELDDEFKRKQHQLRDSFAALEHLEHVFFEINPDEGRIRRLLIAIEESLLTSSDPRAAAVRVVLSQPELDISKLNDLMSDLRNELHFRSLLQKIEHELNKRR